MRAPLFHVDAFASGPFTGNPAAVCLLEKPAGPAWMQAVAAAGASHGRIGWVLELADASEVRAVRPDFAKLAAFEIAVVTARSDDSRYDFVSRCFGPKFGIDEDPVTGSAHCALGPYWAERLGETELIGYQASARGGVVLVRVDRDRTALPGRAGTVTRGGLVA